MTLKSLPLLISPQQLQAALGSEGLMVIDLSRADTHWQAHIPGARFLEYGDIIGGIPPATGQLPEPDRLERVFTELGLTPDTQVVAYDDEGGGKACRLLWTLAALGHEHWSLLDGGLHAWHGAGLPLTRSRSRVAPGQYPIGSEFPAIAQVAVDRGEILEQLQNPRFALLDVRSVQEFNGEKRFSARGGHIPGAVNMEWTLAMDPEQQLRLRPQTQLRQLLQERGISADSPVVTYCQTHHRSAHTWFVLRHLGYAQARAYPGSWSEWGNLDDTPIAT